MKTYSMKQFVAIMMAVILFWLCIPFASAEQVALESRPSPVQTQSANHFLDGFAYTSDDYIYREYNDVSTISIPMEVNDIVTTPVFHAIDSSFLSFIADNEKISSTNEAVATARFEIGYMCPVGTVAPPNMDCYLYLSIEAHATGRTTIIAPYHTYLTASAREKYIDNRGGTGFSKRIDINVTTEGVEITTAWVDTNDSPVNHSIMGKGTVANQKGTANSTAGSVAVGKAKDTVAGEILSNAVQKVLTFVGFGAFGGIKGAVAGLVVGVIVAGITGIYDFWQVNQDKKTEAILYGPEPMYITWKIKNNNYFDITNVSIVAQSNAFYFYYPQSWINYVIKHIGTIAKNDTYELKIKVYPIPMVNRTENPIAEVAKGQVSAELSYVVPYPLQKETISISSTALPIYSSLTQQDVYNHSRLPNWINERYGSNFAIQCPVDVLIQNRQGELITTVQNGQTDVFSDGHVTAWADGEAKYITISHDKLNEYHLQLQATDDGTMDVTAFDQVIGADICIPMFEDVPLVKGDIFDIDHTGKVSKLYKQENGMQVEIAPTQILNMDMIRSALAETDISDWAVENVGFAIACGLIAGATPDSFQAPATLSQFCADVLNLVELHRGMDRGLLSDQYIADSVESGLEPYIAAAIGIGLLSSEYYDIALREDAAELPLTVIEAATLLTSCIRMLEEETDSYEKAWQLSDGMTLTEGEMTVLTTAVELELLENVKADAVAAVGEANGQIVDPYQILTYEQSIDMLVRLLQNMERTDERNEAIKAAVDQLLSQMEIYDAGKYETYDYRYLPNDDAQQLLRNVSVCENYMGLSGKTMSMSELVEVSEKLLMEQTKLSWQRDLGFSPFHIKKMNELKERVILIDAEISFTDDEGTLYRLVPVYYTTENGIYEDCIYIVCNVFGNGSDELFAQEKGFNPATGYRMDTLWITDQQLVVELLKLNYKKLQNSMESILP